MEEIKCEQVGMLSGEKWDKCHDANRRVYSSNGLSPTITTMGGGQREPKIIEPICLNSKVNGKQPSLTDRVYDTNGIATCVTTSPFFMGSIAESCAIAGGGYSMKIYVPEATKKGYDTATYGDSINMAYPNSKTRRGRVGHGIAQTLTTGDSQQVVVEPIAYDEQNGYLRQDGCVGTLTTDGSSPKHNNRIVEPIYELSNAMKRYINAKHDKYKVSEGNLLVNRDIACAKTTREGSTRADASDYISPDLPENTNVAGKDLVKYRIRKLTPGECFRLMGVKEDDYIRVAKNQSISSQYHLAGDSIVTTCLMAILGELLSVDYKTKINELVEELKQ